MILKITLQNKIKKGNQNIENIDKNSTSTGGVWWVI